MGKGRLTQKSSGGLEGSRRAIKTLFYLTSVFGGEKIVQRWKQNELKEMQTHHLEYQGPFVASLTHLFFSLFFFFTIFCFLSLSFSPFSLAFYLEFPRDEHMVLSLSWLLEPRFTDQYRLGIKNTQTLVAFIPWCTRVYSLTVEPGFCLKSLR